MSTTNTRKLPSLALQACAGALLALLPLAAGCDRSAEANTAPAAEETHLTQVVTVAPTRKDLVRVIEQPGYILPYEQTPIYTKIAGYAEEPEVDIGDVVKKDELLVKLWVPEVEDDLDVKEAAVEQASADLVQAKANARAAAATVVACQARVKQAEAGILKWQAEVDRWGKELDRAQRLLGKGVFDKQTRDEQENELKASQASLAEAVAVVDSAKATLDEAIAREEKASADVKVAEAHLKVTRAQYRQWKSWLDYSNVCAPFDGIITRRNVHKGHFLQPSNSGSTSKAADPLFVVERTDLLRVTVQVPELDAGMVRMDQTKKGLLRITAASLRALRGAEVPEEVVKKLEPLTREAFLPRDSFLAKLATVLSKHERSLYQRRVINRAEQKGDTMVKEGDRAVIRPQAMPGREFAGTVTRYSYSYDEHARTQRVEIHLPNPGGELRPGMYVNAFIYAHQPQVLTLPAEAIRSDILANGDRTYCMAVEGGKVHKLFVQVGPRGEDGLQQVVRKMGPEGKWVEFTGTEAVVASNPAALVDGQAVEVHAPDNQ